MIFIRKEDAMDLSEYNSKKERIDNHLEKIEASINIETIKIKKAKRKLNNSKKKQQYNNIIKAGLLLSEALPASYDQEEVKQYLSQYKKGDDNYGMDT